MMKYLSYLLAVGLGVLALPAHAGESVRLTGSSTVAPVMQEIALNFQSENPDIRIFVETGGSGKGLRDLQAGLNDIAMVSRVLLPEEAALYTAHILAIDGVAPLVHAENPLSQLDRQSLAAIFTGQITNWAALGGQDQPIIVVGKGEGRATAKVFNQYLGLKANQIKAAIIAAENAQMIKTIMITKGAIGYVSIGAGLVEQEFGAPIKLLSITQDNGRAIKPNLEIVAAGQYPISRPLILVTKGPLSPLAQKFIAYSLSDKAANSIARLHYVQARH